MDVTVIEKLPVLEFFKVKPDQLCEVRKLFNLEKPERIKEAIQLLKDWLQKQDYFNKKDYPDEYMERLLILNKGSVERAKLCFDKLCTFRTIWPHYFTAVDINSFEGYFTVFNSIVLPDVTPEYARVNIFKVNSNVPLGADLIKEYIKYSIILCEYMKKYDYPNGFVILLDYRDVNLLDLLAILSPSQLQQMVHLYMGGFGMRIQGVHLITKSKLSDALVSLLKQVVSKKLADRVHVHRSLDTLYDFVPKKILPAEYGGDAEPFDVMMENFIKELGSTEHIEYMKETQKATVDLSKKPKDGSIDDYMGMSGSFRTLSVD
ncbi:alpha-tocopherol transfer protein-like [Cydia amplana]|uniref:alpha-tocopherol transfer protein-like n=1 Tax=Cydia amplana TaxID=1869771 RepID=UPI002FE552D7